MSATVRFAVMPVTRMSCIPLPLRRARIVAAPRGAVPAGGRRLVPKCLIMRKSRVVRLSVSAALVAAAVTPALIGVGGAVAGAAQCPWMDRHKSADTRAHELVKAMTLDQKNAELYGRGDLTYYGAANDIPAVPALCIPELVFNDAGAGVGDAMVGTTAFPDGITQASSWDRAMQSRVGAAIGWRRGTRAS